MGSRVAFCFYLGFVGSWFLHLTSRVPALGAIRLDLLLVLLTGLFALAAGGPSALGRQRSTVSWALCAITAYSVITVPLVEWPGSVVRFGLISFIKAVVFYFFTIRLVTTERRLRQLLLVFVLCQAFRIIEPAYLHVTTGYWGDVASMDEGARVMDRLAGAPHDVIGPNGLAFVILTVICFSHYLSAGSWLGRLAYVAVLPVCLYALMLTGSRTGMLGLAIVFATAWFKSHHKSVLAMVAVAALLAVLPRMSDDLVDRYRSLVDGTAGNAATVQRRIEGVMSNFGVALRRPLFGHGLGTSREANANFGGGDQPAHNLYAETAQEIGFLGLGIFLVFLGAVGWELWSHQSQWRSAAAPAIVRTGDALQVFMVMNLLFSLASYGLRSYEWYLLAGLTEVLTRLGGEHGATGGAPLRSPMSS